MSILKDILEQRGMPCCSGCGMRMKMMEGTCPDCGVNYGLSMGAKNAPGMSEGTETTDAKSDVDNSEPSMNKISKKTKSSKIVFSQGEDDSTKKVQEDVYTSEYTIKKYVDQYGKSRTRKMRPHRIEFKNSKSGAEPSQQDDSTKRVQEDMKTTYKDMITAYSAMRVESLQLEDEINEVLSKDAAAGEWISDFVHSDNPKFAGKSKEKRKQMALAAYYAKQRNEDVELDEVAAWNPIKHIPKENQNKAIKTAAKDVKRGSYADRAALLKAGGVKKEEAEMDEELKGNQHKLDKNKNGKIDAEDFKKLRKEDSEIEEGTGSLKPGWMLKKDPELAKKVKEKIDLAKKRQATYGDKSAGKSVSEEVELDEESTYKKVGVKNLDDWKAHAKKHGYTVQKLSDTHHQAWREGQHGGAHLTGTHFAGNKDHKSEQWMRIPKKVSEEVELNEATVGQIAQAHGFQKQTSGASKGSYKHPKTGETITALRDQTFGHSTNDGGTIASFKHKNSLEKHLADKGYKKAVSEEVEEIDEAEYKISTAQMGHAGKTTIKHIKNPDVTQRMAAHDVKSYADRIALLKDAKRKGNLKEDDMQESAFDWKNNPRETKDKTKTSTYHDVKKISTGTVYTKQFDKDGTSKGTGGDAAAKAENAPKRGRGRPKKDKFAESVEILMSLSEDQFDSMMEDGFDTFFEAFEQLDEASKAALKSCGKSTK